MILTFQKRFVQPILDGTKIHTIREDKHNRWNVGMKIQFWCGNPRNVKKHPYQFAEGIVRRIGKVKIYANENRIRLDQFYWEYPFLNVKDDVLDYFAQNDGFKDWEEMKEFFPKYFKGRLIIWEQPVNDLGVINLKQP